MPPKKPTYPHSLHDSISEERQNYLLNPQNRDYYITHLYHTYGRRVYSVKVGWKWVYLRSNAHVQRMRLSKFKEIAMSNWIRDSKADASFQAYKDTGSYKRTDKNWYIKYGFKVNPERHTLLELIEIHGES